MQWMTTEQVAQRMGVTPGTVRRWCTERALPYSNIGVGRVKIRIAGEDLDAWIKSQRLAA